MISCNSKYILIFLFIFYVIYLLNSYERFDNSCLINFKEYNELIYPISLKITNDENIFISKWINKLKKDDIEKNPNISTYMIGFTIDKNNFVNRSRFGIGTLSYHNEFKKDCIKFLNSYQINLKEPNGYLWYAVAWDIFDNLYKVYLLSKDKKKIICYVYKVKRSKKNSIIDIVLSDKKYYNVGKKKTIMYKNRKKILQVNSTTLPSVYIKRYPTSAIILKNMINDGWDLNTYSEYDNKLNLYFD
tara:strand:+ start:1219 stop:1953 length:735 start_codon:yes stop_codon:yes gene_type:complete